MTLILIYRASKPVMFGLLGCLVYHRKELVKEYLMLSELTVPNVSLWHSFKGIKVARFKLIRYQGCEGCKGWKCCKIWLSNFKDIKVTRLQGCKGCKIRLFSFDPIKLGKRGGEGGEINTSDLNCNQLLNISKMVQLIFAKLVSHFRQLNRVLSKWQVFLGFSSDSEIFQVRWWWNLVGI